MRRRLLLSLLVALLPSAATFAQVVIVERNVNLRRDPSTDNPEIRLLKPPEQLELLDPDRTAGYYHVRSRDDEEGFVWSRNVRVDPDGHVDWGPEIPAFDRDNWKHWIDADHDCQSTRNEVLIRDSTGPMTFRPRADGKHCTVLTGRWVDPYSGEVFTDPAKLDIDHVVALQYDLAYRSESQFSAHPGLSALLRYFQWGVDGTRDSVIETPGPAFPGQDRSAALLTAHLADHVFRAFGVIDEPPIDEVIARLSKADEDADAADAVARRARRGKT